MLAIYIFWAKKYKSQINKHYYKNKINMSYNVILVIR